LPTFSGAEVKNQCAGPFGAVYDFYIEREWLASAIARVLWGIELAPMYAAMAEIARVGDGATIVDAPCGGGVALRGLRAEQDVRYVAADIAAPMLERIRGRAGASGLTQVETLEADMRALPLPDASADLFCTFSGLHMIDDPKAAIAEIARVLKPGGRLLGSAFVADGSRRQRALFALGARQGHAALAGTAADHAAWLRAAGFTDVSVTAGGFAVFRARRL
jgi:ubiquinone/menaquinone biosynthesis C-methylase UbiE